MQPSVQIIILAGGQGKRMGSETPKALTLFGGRPIIEYSLDAVAELGLPSAPVVVVGFGAEQVRERLGNRAVYALQAEQLGTGHAVLCAKEKVGDAAESVVVLYGDMPAISQETIKNLFALHSREGADLTMMTIRVPHFSEAYSGFFGFGRIVRSEDGNIKKIVELKDASEDEKKITELNPSLFCFKSDWLWESLPRLKNNNVQGEYYLTDLVGLAISQNKKIASLEIDPMECIGVNTPEELRIANEIILGK